MHLHELLDHQAEPAPRVARRQALLHDRRARGHLLGKGLGQQRFLGLEVPVDGCDTYIRSGTLRDVVPTTFPYRTGFDAAGVVDEVGEGVTGVGIGDEVFGMTTMAARGANADFAVLAAWAPKPAAWSWEEAGGAAGAHGVHMSHGAPADHTGAVLGAPADPLAVHGLAIAVTLAGQGRLRVPVAAAFPLAEAAAAHELSESRHARGKIVLVN